MTFEVYRDAKQEWRWRFVSGNGKIVATSGGDGYQNLKDCYDGIRLVKASQNVAVKNLETDEIVVL